VADFFMSVSGVEESMSMRALEYFCGGDGGLFEVDIVGVLVSVRRDGLLCFEAEFIEEEDEEFKIEEAEEEGKIEEDDSSDRLKCPFEEEFADV
jgi:hypothetical protein